MRQGAIVDNRLLAAALIDIQRQQQARDARTLEHKRMTLREEDLFRKSSEDAGLLTLVVAEDQQSSRQPSLEWPRRAPRAALTLIASSPKLSNGSQRCSRLHTEAIAWQQALGTVYPRRAERASRMRSSRAATFPLHAAIAPRPTSTAGAFSDDRTRMHGSTVLPIPHSVGI